MSYLLLASSGADSADALWHYRVTIKDRALVQWDAQVSIISGAEITDQWDARARIQNRALDQFDLRASIESGALEAWHGLARIKDVQTSTYHARAAIKSTGTAIWHAQVSLGAFATVSYDGRVVLVRTDVVVPTPERMFFAPKRVRHFFAKKSRRR